MFEDSFEVLVHSSELHVLRYGATCYLPHPHAGKNSNNSNSSIGFLNWQCGLENQVYAGDVTWVVSSLGVVSFTSYRCFLPYMGFCSS
jgi:hypothetical protein